MQTKISVFPWRRLLAGTLLVAAPLLGWAQQPVDPPTRVAYVSAQDGSALISSPGSAAGDGWAPAALNWPVTSGTRIAGEPGSRTELHGGWTALRLAGKSNLDITQLDDTTTQVALTEGALSVRVRELQPGERVEVDTPQLAMVANQPGEYRIDVDPRSGTTRVTVHAGTATVYGDAGQSITVANRQQFTFGDRALSVVQRGSAGGRDSLDQWAAARDAQEDQSISARYVSRDMPGYQLLDNYGEWTQDPTYGAVWYPSVTVTDWAPYRYGRWSYVEPWGWTWVDDAPWGFAPSHYGRWAQIGPRWAWVPGPMARRPVYAPALVGFVGGGSGGSQWGVSIGGGLPAAAWFPLAPGEYWQPGYRVSDRYRNRLNPGGFFRPPPDGYRYQRRPDAVSVAPPGGFGGGNDPRNRPPRFGDGSRLPPGALGNAQIVPPPPRGNAPASGRAPMPMPRPDFSRSPDPRAPVPGAVIGGNRPGAVPPSRPIDGRDVLYGDDAAAAAHRDRDRMPRDPQRPWQQPPSMPQPQPPMPQRQDNVARPPRQMQELPAPRVQQPPAMPPRGNAPAFERPQPQRQFEAPAMQPQRAAPQQPARAMPEMGNRGGERANPAPRERNREERDGRSRRLDDNH